jgi:glyoxylase-like metal-dependent hydrolase (beta-lactamase superfamily II)
MPKIKILRVSESFTSNVYLIGQDKYLVIDTGLKAQYLANALQKSNIQIENLEQIVLTHSHIDHIGGLNKLVEYTSANVSIHETEAIYVEEGDKRATAAAVFSVQLQGTPINSKLREGDIIKWDEFSFQVLHTPGHSCGSICLYEENKRILFSGDTVFAHGSFGRTDLPPGGDSKDLVNSLQRLADLDIEILAPGHMDVVNNGQMHITKSYEAAKIYL